MVMSTLSTIYGGYKLANNLTGGRIGKFIKKNTGKAIGMLGNFALNKLPLSDSTKQTIQNVADKGQELVKNILGEDNEISKNVTNFSKELKGESVAFRPADEGDEKSTKPVESNTSAVVPYETSGTPYIANLGGSRYGMSRYKIPRMVKRNTAALAMIAHNQGAKAKKSVKKKRKM